MTAGNGGRLVLRNVTIVDNPVADVANLHQISAVVRAGRHYSTADLTRLKDRVRTANPAT